MFPDRPHAFPKLWKHHAAQRQADRINALAAERGEPWLARYGGLISSEWEFAKALQVLEEDPEIYERTERWIEAADWIVWQLCGRETRNVCATGYKAIYQDGRFPSPEYLGALNERFADFPSTRIEGFPFLPLGACAGRLTAQAAGWTGLPEGIAVAAGNVDAHVTAPAAGAVDPGQMLMVMGTSTCHVMNGDRARRGAGHVRRRATAASCPACGATRPARAASGTSSAGSSTTSPARDARRAQPRAPPSRRSASTG